VHPSRGPGPRSPVLRVRAGASTLRNNAAEDSLLCCRQLAESTTLVALHRVICWATSDELPARLKHIALTRNNPRPQLLPSRRAPVDVAGFADSHLKSQRSETGAGALRGPVECT
jgi:hypothetical protein